MLKVCTNIERHTWAAVARGVQRFDLGVYLDSTYTSLCLDAP